MFLSRLVLEGFKSYSERVQVDFGPNIAVIIGSNGVGKSNALEAVVWALGENEEAGIRYGTYRDLLFCGSSMTPPAEEAVVELTFEDAGKEFSINRVLKASGEEQFRVGAEPIATLEKYHEALNRLGLGNGRHNVIRQEELTDFFAKSPQARLEYVEKYTSAAHGLTRTNELIETYLNAMIPGTHARLDLGANGSQVDVEVLFPDKGLKRGVLLSGGERAVTALALKLALFESQQSPFYLLDEVEPSLDWTRNHNMQELLKNLSQNRQLIMVTHFQSTIRMANTVHGVRIRPDGSSWLKFHFLMDERLFKVYKCC